MDNLDFFRRRRMALSASAVIKTRCSEISWMAGNNGIERICLVAFGFVLFASLRLRSLSFSGIRGLFYSQAIVDV